MGYFKINLLVLFLIILTGCGTLKKIEVEHRIETHYVDSTIWHLDTAYFDVPREVYKDYSGLLDTLKLETSMASSWAAVDTNKMVLAGEIKNKSTKLEKEVLWKEKIVYRDSLVTKEVPVPLEIIKEVVPKWCWWLLGFNIAILVLALAWVLAKLKVF